MLLVITCIFIIFSLKRWIRNIDSTIILESCCGTGKTFSVVKYIASLANKTDIVLSIINRKSLLTAKLKEFENMNVSLNNYMDKDSYDLKENGIICVNSIMKYFRVPAED